MRRAIRSANRNNNNPNNMNNNLGLRLSSTAQRGRPPVHGPRAGVRAVQVSVRLRVSDLSGRPASVMASATAGPERSAGTGKDKPAGPGS